MILWFSAKFSIISALVQKSFDAQVKKGGLTILPYHRIRIKIFFCPVDTLEQVLERFQKR